MAFQLGARCRERAIGVRAVEMARPASFRSEKFAHWAIQLVADDFLVDDVDALEDGLVEERASFIAREAVQLVRILEEGHVGVDVLGAGRKVVVDA